MKKFHNIKSPSPILLLFLLIISSSCAKLAVYKSKPYRQSTNWETAKAIAVHFDKKNNIHYGVANNDTSFYFAAVFHDPNSVNKIMRGGLNLYFDPKGKKEKNYRLKIERSEKQPIYEKASAVQQSGFPHNSMQNTQALINMFYTKVTWNANGKEFVFHRTLQKHPIEINFYTNELNELLMELQMPLNEIPIPDNKLLSIGLETDSFPSGGGKSAGGMRPAGGMRGGRGGGMGSGGSYGKGMSGGGRRQAGAALGVSATSAGISPVKIWFGVQLLKN